MIDWLVGWLIDWSTSRSRSRSSRGRRSRRTSTPQPLSSPTLRIRKLRGCSEQVDSIEEELEMQAVEVKQVEVDRSKK